MMKLRDRVQGLVAVFAAADFAPRLRLYWRLWLRNMGRAGMLAIGLLAICISFYVSAMQPMQARLETARKTIAALNLQRGSGALAASDGKLSTEDQLGVFYRNFPEEGNASHWLGKLVALAESRGLHLHDGEYKATRDKVGKLLRYQMTFPLKGPYPQIRKFLTDLPEALPLVALESLQFERKKITDPEVDARIRLVLYLEQAP